ncbi:MAG: hypothetical protein ACRDHU_01875 [Actinomycetota bacterium]
MVLGIVLIALGAFGAAIIAGFLLGASSDGTLGLWAFGSVNPRIGAALAAGVAVAATTLFLLGLASTHRGRRRRVEARHVDTRARDAEQEARATLLAMRLEVLQREVGELERKRDGALEALGEPRAPEGVLVYTPSRSDRDEELVVLEED